MRGLLAILYFAAIGWAISHYELDKLAAEAAENLWRHMARQSALVHLEVQRAELGTGWAYQAVHPELAGLLFVAPLELEQPKVVPPHAG